MAARMAVAHGDMELEHPCDIACAGRGDCESAPVPPGAVAFTILSARNLVVQRLSGTIGVRELRTLALGVRNDPLYRERMSILTDLRRAKLDVSYEDTLDYVGFLANLGAVGRHAVIVNDQLNFGLVRMFEQVSEAVVQREQFRIFFDTTAAAGWLHGALACLRNPSCRPAAGALPALA